VLGAGLVRAEREKRTRCLGTDAKLAGVWELPSAKGGISPRKEAIRRAFMSTGKRYAADSFEVVRNALDRYVTDWNDMHRESCEATNIRGEQSAEVLDLRTSCLQDRFAEVRALTNVFSDATGEVVVKSASAVQAIRPVEQCADIVALRAVVKPPDDPQVRRTVADVRTQLADVRALSAAGRYRRALENLRSIVSAARETKYSAVIGEAVLILGETQEALADPDAEQSYEEAYLLAEGSRHDEVALEAADQLISVVGRAQARHVEAQRWSRIAEAILTRLGPGHDVLAAWRANNLAIVLDGRGEHEQALALFQKALKMKMRAVGEMHPDVGLSLSNIAYALHRMGRTDEAIRNNERALHILKATIGPEHPHSADTLANQAEFLIDRGQADEARAIAEQALSIMERELGIDHPDLAIPLMVLGLSDLLLGKAASAVSILERSLRICESSSPLHPRVAEVRFGLARALWEGDHSSRSALALAERARTELGGNPAAKTKMASVDRWIAARRENNARLSMR
jgi:tetratricopeptide (TPR) repeat protein